MACRPACVDLLEHCSYGKFAMVPVDPTPSDHALTMMNETSNPRWIFHLAIYVLCEAATCVTPMRYV